VGLIARRGKKKTKHNLIPMSLSRIYTPKSIGGLGMSSMATQNKALLAKLGWKLMKGEDLHWTNALKNKYLKNSNLLAVKPSP
jgi:hypothetical protein